MASCVSTLTLDLSYIMLLPPSKRICSTLQYWAWSDPTGGLRGAGLTLSPSKIAIFEGESVNPSKIKIFWKFPTKKPAKPTIFGVFLRNCTPIFQPFISHVILMSDVRNPENSQHSSAYTTQISSREQGRRNLRVIQNFSPPVLRPTVHTVICP